MWINVIKFSIVAIFFNYYCSPLLFGRLIPNVTAICYGIMLICFLFDNGSKIGFGSEIRTWILYLVICFALVIFQSNQDWIIGSLLEFAQH